MIKVLSLVSNDYSSVFEENKTFIFMSIFYYTAKINAISQKYILQMNQFCAQLMILFMKENECAIRSGACVL